jgi:hypothetical protein
MSKAAIKKSFKLSHKFAVAAVTRQNNAFGRLNEITAESVGFKNALPIFIAPG